MVEGLFESAPYAMLLVDGAGRILNGNAQLELLFDYPQAEMLTQSIALLLPTFLRHISLASSTRMGPLELPGRRKDGMEFPVEIMLASLPTADMRQTTQAETDSGAAPRPT